MLHFRDSPGFVSSPRAPTSAAIDDIAINSCRFIFSALFLYQNRRAPNFLLPFAGGVGGAERKIVGRIGVGDGRAVGVGFRETIAGVRIVSPSRCIAIGRDKRDRSRGAERGERRTAALRVVGVVHGIGCAPFGGEVTERIVGAVGCVAERVGGRNAVAEHVVGVGFGCAVGVVGVGVWQGGRRRGCRCRMQRARCSLSQLEPPRWRLSQLG